MQEALSRHREESEQETSHSGEIREALKSLNARRRRARSRDSAGHGQAMPPGTGLSGQGAGDAFEQSVFRHGYRDHRGFLVHRRSATRASCGCGGCAARTGARTARRRKVYRVDVVDRPRLDAVAVLVYRRGASGLEVLTRKNLRPAAYFRAARRWCCRIRPTLPARGGDRRGAPGARGQGRGGAASPRGRGGARGGRAST